MLLGGLPSRWRQLATRWMGHSPSLVSTSRRWRRKLMSRRRQVSTMEATAAIFGAGLRTANVQPLFAAQRQRPHPAFTGVVVGFNPPIVKIFFHPDPLPQGIVALGPLAARRDLLADLLQAPMQCRHQRHTLASPANVCRLSHAPTLPSSTAFRLGGVSNTDTFNRHWTGILSVRSVAVTSAAKFHASAGCSTPIGSTSRSICFCFSYRASRKS